MNSGDREPSLLVSGAGAVWSYC